MLASDVNLAVQLGVLVVITVGVLYVKRYNVGLHGSLLLLSVIVNGLSIATVMVPSAFRILDGASVNNFSLTVGLHALVGVIVELIGLYIVLDWRLRDGSCIRFKPYMRALAPVWVTIALVGLYMYASLYL